jgi:hypothetical protein
MKEDKLVRTYEKFKQNFGQEALRGRGAVVV